MNAYDHEDITTIEGDKSDVEVSFTCKQLGGREYHVKVYATVWMNTMIEDGDNLHPTFVDSEVEEIEINSEIITTVEGDAIQMFNTPITEDFLKDQVKDHCITV